MMELKKLYRDATMLARCEIPQNDFLLFADMGARTLLSKYPKKLLLPKGQYSSPKSITDTLAISGEFYNAMIYFIAGSYLSNEKYLEESGEAASYAYIKLWRESARGKRIKGDKW